MSDKRKVRKERNKKVIKIERINKILNWNPSKIISASENRCPMNLNKFPQHRHKLKWHSLNFWQTILLYWETSILFIINPVIINLFSPQRSPTFGICHLRIILIEPWTKESILVTFSLTNSQMCKRVMCVSL